VVDISYQAVHLSQFISTMIESTVDAFEVKIDCKCDEINVRTVKLDEINIRHEEWLEYLQDK